MAQSWLVFVVATGPLRSGWSRLTLLLKTTPNSTRLRRLTKRAAYGGRKSQAESPPMAAWCKICARSPFGCVNASKTKRAGSVSAPAKSSTESRLKRALVGQALTELVPWTKYWSSPFCSPFSSRACYLSARPTQIHRFCFGLSSKNKLLLSPLKIPVLNK